MNAATPGLRRRERDLKKISPKASLDRHHLNDESASAVDGMLNPRLLPSSRGGVDATPKKYRRRHPWIGADGVVRNLSDHPVCASMVATQLFLDRAATPPLEEGNSGRAVNASSRKSRS